MNMQDMHVFMGVETHECLSRRSHPPRKHLLSAACSSSSVLAALAGTHRCRMLEPSKSTQELFLSPPAIDIGDHDDRSSIARNSLAPSPRTTLGPARRATSPFQPSTPRSAGVRSSIGSSLGRRSTTPTAASPLSFSSGVESPLSPRQKKESRLLHREMKNVRATLEKMHRRVDGALCVVQGTMNQLENAMRDAQIRIGQNPQLVRRSFGGTDKTTAPMVNGQLLADAAWASGKPEKLIVDALSELSAAAIRSLKLLAPHEAGLATHLERLSEITEDLDEHHDAHGSQLAEAASNPMASPSMPLAGSYVSASPSRATNKFGSTLTFKYVATSDALSLAEERLSTAQRAVHLALEAQRESRADHEARRTSLQVAVREARHRQQKAFRARRYGKFGTTDRRVTDPTRRKLPHTPETSIEHHWPTTTQVV